MHDNSLDNLTYSLRNLTDVNEVKVNKSELNLKKEHYNVFLLI